MIKLNFFDNVLIDKIEVIADSIKFETVKFVFPDNWAGYKKTAIFKSESGFCCNVVLEQGNPLCVADDECYIPHEMLVENEFSVSVFGVLGDSLATTTEAKINVIKSGYALGDAPHNPTPSEYQQLIELTEKTKQIAQSVRDDADNGVFRGDKGEKGDKGEPFVYSDFTAEQLDNLKGPKGDIGPTGQKGDKGDKGDAYILTEADKTEIAESVNGSVTKIKQELLGLRPKYLNLFTTGHIDKIAGYWNNASSKNTGLIPILNGEKLKYTTVLGDSGYEVAFYDENKELLHDISVVGRGSVEENIIDLTEEKYSLAKYFIISFYASALYPYELFHGVLYCENNLTHRVEKLENKESVGVADFEVYVSAKGNQFDKNAVKMGFEVYSDGTLQKQSASAISDYIYVKGQQHICLNNLPKYTGINRFSRFYDENKNPIGDNIAIDKQVTQYTVAIPEGAHYYAFSIYQRLSSGSNDFDNVMVTFDECREYEPFGECVRSIAGYKIENETVQQVATTGKRMLVFGDSITETANMNDDGSNYCEGVRTNWLTFAKTYLNTSNFKNYAMSGATYKDTESTQYRQNLSEQMALAMANPENDDAEIVVMSLGTNDGNISIGNYATAMSKATLEELDRTNLYEALRWAMWTLRNKYTSATFFVGMPIQRTDREQPNELLEAIRKMAQRYNFIIIDATNESGIVREFEVQGANGMYLYDGLHPNVEGSKKLAKLYSNVILRNFIV